MTTQQRKSLLSFGRNRGGDQARDAQPGGQSAQAEQAGGPAAPAGSADPEPGLARAPGASLPPAAIAAPSDGAPGTGAGAPEAAGPGAAGSGGERSATEVDPPKRNEAAGGATQPPVTRRWERGPDPTVDACPKGNKPAAALWRVRKSIIDLEARKESITGDITIAGRDERAAYDAWERRQRLDGDQETIKARRRAGVGAAEIETLAELAKAKGQTVEQYLVSLRSDGAAAR